MPFLNNKNRRKYSRRSRYNKQKEVAAEKADAEKAKERISKEGNKKLGRALTTALKHWNEIDSVTEPVAVMVQIISGKIKGVCVTSGRTKG